MLVIEKPWGKEELLERNERYMFKRLTMRQGHRCSLQKHERKDETIYVLQGKLKILHGDDPARLAEEIFTPGQSITIPAGIIHRMEALEDSLYLEASTPEMDDVIRFSDDYQRVK